MKLDGRVIGRMAMLILIAAVASACNQARPIYQVENQPIPQVFPPLTLKQIKARILNVDQIQNWKLKVLEPGKIDGLLTIKQHSAVVTIDFNQQVYSIRYKSSYRLKAGMALVNDPRQGKFLIHHSFNSSVRTLKKNIDYELRAPGR